MHFPPLSLLLLSLDIYYAKRVYQQHLYLKNLVLAVATMLLVTVAKVYAQHRVVGMLYFGGI